MEFHCRCKCGTTYGLYTEGENGMMPAKYKMSKNEIFHCFCCGQKNNYKNFKNINLNKNKIKRRKQ